MSSTLLLPPREQLCNRSCSNKTHTLSSFGNNSDELSYTTTYGTREGRTSVVWKCLSERKLGPSYFFISLVIGPLNSLVWYVPSLRYTRGLGWRMYCGVEVTESSTNKQHHLSQPGSARGGGVPVTNVEGDVSSTISTLGDTATRRVSCGGSAHLPVRAEEQSWGGRARTNCLLVGWPG